MRNQTTFAIDGYTYEVTQIGALEGRRLAVRLGRLLGEFAPALKHVSKAEDGSLKFDIAELPELIDSLDEEKLEPFWTAFSALTQVKSNGGRAQLSEVFDDHFAGRYAAMAKFFAECVKFNFGGFLEEAKSLVP